MSTIIEWSGIFCERRRGATSGSLLLGLKQWMRFWAEATSSHAMASAQQDSGHSHVMLADRVSTDDRADILSAVGGDHDAFRRLVERHQQEVGRFLWKFTRDRNLWDELLQTVFVKAYVSLGKFRGDANFVDWLKGIATHVGYRSWTVRQKQQHRLKTLAESRETLETTATERELGLFELMEQLTPRDRLVLTLIYVEERSVADAAKLAGWTESMVKSQAHRARARLKELWDGQQ
jgi:RNA polymerase sigma-70 factor, ECF subfamily